MGFIASITIFQCDDCQKFVSVKSDEEWEKFVSDWHEGIMNIFCLDCRYKPENAEAVKADTSFSNFADQAVQKFAKSGV